MPLPVPSSLAKLALYGGNAPARSYTIELSTYIDGKPYTYGFCIPPMSQDENEPRVLEHHIAEGLYKLWKHAEKVASGEA